VKHRTSSLDEEARAIAPSSVSQSIDTVTIELLAGWRAEDATQDPKEIELAEKELAEFKKAMNDNRRRSEEPLAYS
jgi:hypothetical protein